MKIANFLKPSIKARKPRVEWLPLITLIPLDSKTFTTECKPQRSKRSYISPLTKRVIAASQQWRCNICTQLLPACYEIDHIIPLFREGSNDSNNLQALCRNCHGVKSMKENEERTGTQMDELRHSSKNS
jgi:5-methylcytosine-specific restriction endonuclease McrA